MMKDITGQRIPAFEFNILEEFSWVQKTTEELFGGKRIVLFALPGAFTPTCSSLHLPEYNELFDTFREYGIDGVYCLAVNDSFVLNAWRKAQKADNIVMLPDPDGEFSRRLGFLVNRSDLCLGDRSWRYAMVIENGVIEKMFIEPDTNSGRGDPYGKSSAETVLKYLNPDAAIPPAITIFSREACPICAQAKSSLRQLHYTFEELILNENFSIKTVKAISGSTRIPQFFVNGERFETFEAVELFLKTKHVPDRSAGRERESFS